MKLVQFSSPYCSPCIAAKRILSEKLDSNTYIYIDLMKERDHKMMYLLQIAKSSSVPQFFLLGENDRLEDYWVGFSMQKINDVVSKLQTSS